MQSHVKRGCHLWEEEMAADYLLRTGLQLVITVYRTNERLSQILYRSDKMDVNSRYSERQLSQILQRKQGWNCY
jgi:hypothetical protein